MNEFSRYADDDLDPSVRADRDEELDRTHGAPEYTRAREDYMPASGLWYGADLIAKASRVGKGGNATPAPFIGEGGAGGNFDDGREQAA